jgi:hypothetical protein
MDKTNLAPPSPGWYPGPFSFKKGSLRWWDGSAWTKHTRTLPLRPGDLAAPVGDAPTSNSQEAMGTEVGRPLPRSFRVSANVFAAFSLVLLLFNFGNIVLGVLELLFAVVTVVLGIVMLRARRQERDVSTVLAIALVALGACGVTWFVWTAVDATVLFASQH